MVMQSGENKEDIIKKLKEYNRSLHGYTQMEREYIKEPAAQCGSPSGVR